MFQISTIMQDDTSKIPTVKGTTQVDYSKELLGKKTFLTVSGQLDVENYSVAMSDVYTFGPTFRAENSNTRRHLAEFWMIEPEMAFCGLKEDVQLAIDQVKHCIQFVLCHNREDLDFLNMRLDKQLLERLQHLDQKEFKVITYTKAFELLKKAKTKFENAVTEWGMDFASEHEKQLVDHFKLPCVITDQPADIKSFQMKANEDGKTVQAFDMLVPGIGELIGGSVREESLDKLSNAMLKRGMNLKEYERYLDLRRQGTVPHAGFGLGFERLVMLCTAVDNIKDVIPFPRWPNNAE